MAYADFLKIQDRNKLLTFVRSLQGWRSLSRKRLGESPLIVELEKGLPDGLLPESLPLVCNYAKIFRFKGKEQGSWPWTESVRDFGTTIGFIGLGSPWVLSFSNLRSERKELFVDLKPGTLVTLTGEDREQGCWSFPKQSSVGNGKWKRPKDTTLFCHYLVVLLAKRTNVENHGF